MLCVHYEHFMKKNTLDINIHVLLHSMKSHIHKVTIVTITSMRQL